jgi:hypothetical protein
MGMGKYTNRIEPPLLLVLGLSLAVVAGCAQSDGVKVSGTVHVGNDSIYYSIDRYSGGFAYSDVDPYDTINNELAADLLIYTSLDSVLLTPDTNARYVRIVNGDSSKYITVLYFNQVRKNHDTYFGLLKEHATYSSEPPASGFQFTYALPSDKDLTELRATYNLDSVAGEGGEFSRIWNLMHWAHTIVRHDGSEDPADPKPRNALNIIATCQRDNKGANCRMLATLLNEAYLAMGFRSRHITCMPFDKGDPDCHVINVVYSDSLQKWLYVDATFDAYFMDADCNLLSIEEVRQKMIAGEKLLLPDDINWNGAPNDKRWYTNYMAKNLFRFFCPMASEFGYESKSRCAWVHLNPVGYDTSFAGIPDTTINDGRQFVDYYTTNDHAFWTAP